MKRVRVTKERTRSGEREKRRAPETMKKAQDN
jgi:hypothetical protein